MSALVTSGESSLSFCCTPSKYSLCPRADTRGRSSLQQEEGEGREREREGGKMEGQEEGMQGHGRERRGKGKGKKESRERGGEQGKGMRRVGREVGDGRQWGLLYTYNIHTYILHRLYKLSFGITTQLTSGYVAQSRSTSAPETHERGRSH